MTRIGKTRPARKKPRADRAELFNPPASAPAGPEAVAGASRHFAKHVSTAGQELAKDVDAQLPRDADTRRTRRHARFAQQEVLWGVSTLKRVRECGRVPFAPKGETAATVRMRIKDGVAHYADLARCGSTWACTVCEPNIADKRAEEISKVAAVWDRAGNSVYMATFTAPHDLGMRLAPLMVMIADSFRFAIAGRAWAGTPSRFVPERPSKLGGMLPARSYPARLGVRDRVGIVGTIRSVEVTHGVNGWHPHLHVLVFVHGDPGAEGLALMTGHFREKWKAAVVKAGYRPPDDLHGVKIDRCESAAEAGRYIAKTSGGRSAGNEMARGDLKTGRKGHRTPFQILEDFRQTGDKGDLDLWGEYEKASKGHQKITWSKGLRELIAELADLGEEQTDEELVAEEVGGTDVIAIDTFTWRRVVRIPGLRVLLLDQAEQGGAAAVVALAAGYGIRIVDRGGGCEQAQQQGCESPAA